MKILAIRGAQIASLATEFALDFTVPPLKNAGLFAISGPTGAGKSTILDVLCLALYNTTPRLGGVVQKSLKDDGLSLKDPRQLVRRGAKTAFAAVRFVGQDGGEYTAQWSVNAKSRSKSGDPLGKVQLTLTCEATGQCLGGNLSETLAAIEVRVGLNFEQFCRTVLLAQNDFTAFLKSEPRHKAEMLERITGNALYSRLSTAAFRRQRDAKAAKEALERERALRTLATAAEVAQWQAALASYEQQLAALDAQHAQFQAHEQWLATARQLDDAVTAAEQQLQQAIQAQNEAATRRNALAERQSLRQFAPLWHGWRDAQAAVPPLRGELDDGAAKLAALATDLAAFREDRRWSLATAALTAVQKTHEAALETAQQARQQAQQQLQQAMQARQAAVAAWDGLPLPADATALMARQATLDGAERAWNQCQQAEQALATAANTLAATTAALATAETACAEAQVTAETAQQAWETAKQQQNQQALWADETVLVLRAQLVAGDPCPVCGSREHPLAHEAVAAVKAVVAATAAAASQQGERAATAAARWQEARDQVQRLRQAVTHHQATHAANTAALDEATAAWRSWGGSTAQLSTLRDELAAEIAAHRQAEQARQQAQAAVNGAMAAQDAAQRAVEDAQQRVQTAEMRVQTDQQAVCDWQQWCATAQVRMDGRSDSANAADWPRLQAAAAAAWAAQQARQRDYDDLQAAQQARIARYEAVQIQAQHAEQRLQAAVDAAGYDLAAVTAALAVDAAALQREMAALAAVDEAVRTAASGQQAAFVQRQRHLATAMASPPSAGVVAERDAVRQQWAAMRATVQRDADCRQWHAAHGSQWERATAEFARWDGLNEVIGSSDGQKFRAFAQGLTLDRLLHTANGHLQYFAPRYQLQRLPPVRGREGLELQIQDAEMAAATRSIYSLSGGELFLTSLALALALADTVAHTHLASLFIDEGFGSLDSETLTTALEALERLQRQGRQIGLISHVHDMAERLDVQIRVVKGRSGSSHLVIHGMNSASSSEIVMPNGHLLPP